MLFPVFGSIEHLNELEQRNIGIRRGLDCLAPNRNFCTSTFHTFSLSVSLSLFFFFCDSYFVEFRFLSNHWILITLLLRRTPDFDEINFLPFQPVSPLGSIARSFEISFCDFCRMKNENSIRYEYKTRIGKVIPEITTFANPLFLFSIKLER